MSRFGKFAAACAAVVAFGAFGGTIPDGYVEVEHLEFHRTESFSIPVTFSTSDGYGISLKAQVTSRPNSFGPHILNAGSMWIVYRDDGIFLGSSLNSGKSLTKDVNGNALYVNKGVGQDIEVAFNVNGDGKNYVNGVEPDGTFNVAGYRPGSLYIGQYSGGSGYGLNGLLYHIRLYDHGTLKMNLVPCVKQNGNVPGLYDTENPDPTTAFHVGGGTGQVTPGAALVNDLVTIDALPFEDGGADVQPSYGAHRGYAAGQSYELKAPVEWINEAENERAELIGWTLSKPKGNDWEPVDGGATDICAYVHPDPAEQRKLTWLWRHFYRFDAASVGPGVSVSPASQWVEIGSEGQITATTTKKSLGVIWTGDGITYANSTEKTLTLKGDRVRQVTAMAVSDTARYEATLTEGDWKEFGAWKGAISNLVVASGVAAGESMGCRGDAMTVCFQRIDEDGVLHIQFQVKDSNMLKCVLAEFKIEGGVLYGRKSRKGQYVNGGTPGSHNFETSPGTSYDGYDVCKIVAVTPYVPTRGLVVLFM